MNTHFWERPLFHLAGHHISLLGIIAFMALFATGLIVASAAQSSGIRRLFSRFKLDPKFSAIVTTLLSMAAFVFFTVSAINASGIPLSWNVPLPGVSLSLVQLFLLVALLIAVFWVSSRTKRFLFNRFLVERSRPFVAIRDCPNRQQSRARYRHFSLFLKKTGIHLRRAHSFRRGRRCPYRFLVCKALRAVFHQRTRHLAERPITIGDRVEVAGITGQVQQIRARSTVVITNDNIATIVPNTKFIDSPVTNWTYGDPRVRFRIPVGVAYGSDVKKVSELLIAAGAENPHTLKDPAPSVFFDGFGDNALNFKLVVWSSEMSHRPSRYRSDLNFSIERKLREGGIEIPFPQRDLHIRSGVLKTENIYTDEEEPREPS